MKIVMTGATGYIGRQLCLELNNWGWSVEAIKRGDSLDSMIELLKRTQPDVVIHLASLVLGEHQPSDIDALVESNLAFGLRLAEAMEQAGVRRLINTGTYWQHFNDTKNNPVNLYAATKAAFEELLRFYATANKFQIINLELFDVYGPDDSRPKLIPFLVRSLDSTTVLNLSPGEQILDLVYISDVIAAYVRAAEMLIAETSVNGFMSHFVVSAPSRHTLKDVVNHLKKVSGRSLNVEWGGRPYRKREVMLPWSKGEKLPGWTPKVDIDSGLRKMIGSHDD